MGCLLICLVLCMHSYCSLLCFTSTLPIPLLYCFLRYRRCDDQNSLPVSRRPEPSIDQRLNHCACRQGRQEERSIDGASRRSDDRCTSHNEHVAAVCSGSNCPTQNNTQTITNRRLCGRCRSGGGRMVRFSRDGAGGLCNGRMYSQSLAGVSSRGGAECWSRPGRSHHRHLRPHWRIHLCGEL